VNASLFHAENMHMLRNKEGGFIHNLVLGSLVLIGVLAVAAGYLMDRNQRGLSIAESTRIAREQIPIIRDALMACFVTWPAGNNGTGNHPPYPATPGVGAWGSINDLVCPGAGTSLWTAIRYNVPNAPVYMAQWQYQNVASGIYIKLEAASPDGNAVVQQVATRIPASEKTVTASSLTIQLMQ
jgi:hypothetical protein